MASGLDFPVEHTLDMDTEYASVSRGVTRKSMPETIVNENYEVCEAVLQLGVDSIHWLRINIAWRPVEILWCC